MSILAGIMISIACVVYLSAGALLFATGLLGILFYQMKLFTGKADGGITLADWLGNFIGTGMSDAELAPAARCIKKRQLKQAISIRKFTEKFFAESFISEIFGTNIVNILE